MAKLRCGLIGWPVEHSLSPKLHAYAAKSRGIDLSYELFPLRAAELAAFFEQRRDNDFLGLNVTTPHKSAAFHLLEQNSVIDPACAMIGGVNTVAFTERWQAFNTDYSGAGVLLENLGLTDSAADSERPVVVIGSGPAGRAFALAAAYSGLAPAVLLTREPGTELNNFAVGKRIDIVESNTDWGRSVIAGARVLVNATPLGSSNFPETMPLDSKQHFGRELTVIDLTYSPARTPLIRWAMEKGLRTMNGLGLLCYQAADSFNIWTGSDVTGKELLDYLIAEGHDAALSNGR